MSELRATSQALRERARLVRKNAWHTDELGLSTKGTGLDKRDKDKLQKTLRVLARSGVVTRVWKYADTFLFPRVFTEGAPPEEIFWGAVQLFFNYARRVGYGMTQIRRLVKARGGSAPAWLREEGGEVTVFLGAFELFRRARDGYKRLLEVDMGIPDWKLVPIDVVNQISLRFSEMSSIEIARHFYVLAAFFLKDRAVDLSPFAPICPARALRGSPPKRTRALGKLADAPVPCDKCVVLVKWTASENEALVNYTVRVHVKKDVLLSELQAELGFYMAEEGLLPVWEKALESVGKCLSFASSDFSLEFWKGVSIRCMRNSPRFPAMERREFVLRKEVRAEIRVRVQLKFDEFDDPRGEGVGRKRKHVSPSMFFVERVVTPCDVAHAGRLAYVLYDRLVECLDEAQRSALPYHVAGRIPREVSFFNPSRGEVTSRRFREYQYLFKMLSPVSNDSRRHLSNIRAAPTDLWPLTKVFGRHAGRFFDVYECPKSYCQDGRATLALVF